MFVFAVGVILAYISFRCVYTMIEWLSNTVNIKDNDQVEPDNDIDYSVIIICALCSIGVITICSRSSFIYPFNDWYDSNCYFTVGKSMMNGIIPYRDLFEHKGPLLYFLHGIAWFISKDTFLGVYFMEIISMFVFLFFSYKIMRMYAGKGILYSIPVIALITCTSDAFFYGDSAEELCLPFVAASLWIFLKNIRTKTSFSIKDSVIIGLLSGCVFWIKFSLVGMYVGWYLVYLYECLKGRKKKELLSSTLYIALGVVISTVPYIIYFGLNNSISDWLNVYLIKNIFSYSDAETTNSLINNIVDGIYNMLKHNAYVYYFCLAGAAFLLIFKEVRERYYVLAMLITEFFFVYIGGVSLFYYSLILNLFMIFGMILIYRLLLRVKRIPLVTDHLRIMSFLLTVICIIASFFLSQNSYLIGVDKDELPQYQFARVINKEENPTLLNYGFLDGGFYTVANIFPNCRYFARLNLNPLEIYEIQTGYLEKGLCDYVVSREEIELDNYELVAKSHTYPSDNEDTVYYYLYKLKK